MDWIRRNWPDLLIGVALVAVIAMIVATLLSGGSMTSLFRRNTAPEIPLTSTTGTGNAQTPETETPTNTAQTPETSAGGTNAANDSATGDTAQSGDLDVFVPGTTDASETATENSAAQTDTATSETAAQNENAASGQTNSAATNAAGTATVNAPLPESVINGGFRVAAGAVDSRDGALAAAQTFRDAGYTVTVEPQGDLYLLWIGPYASDAGAERVVARLQEEGLVPDALVYTYDPNEASADAGNAGAGNAGAGNTGAGNVAGAGNANAGNTDTGTTDTGATETGTTSTGNANAGNTATGNATGNTATQSANQTATTPATAADSLTPPAGQRFLQVGAYSSADSAEPQRTQLEGLGLTVTSEEDDNGVVRLYVGPFADAQLAQTQNRLNSQGIDSFPVTP